VLFRVPGVWPWFPENGFAVQTPSGLRVTANATSRAVRILPSCPVSYNYSLYGSSPAKTAIRFGGNTVPTVKKAAGF
jgi:hypothetical protein